MYVQELFMKEKLFPLLSCLVLFISCLKEKDTGNNLSSELYPLARGNKWLYVDSFFSLSGNYFGKDTFYLKAAPTIDFNNHVFTPITDQYDDSIFILRADDTTVHILKPHGESLFFSWPVDNSQPVKTTTYNGGLTRSLIYTERIMTTSFPSYKIVFIHDDGVWTNFRQQEYFFTVGLGIIKGRNQRKNSLGNIYTTDSYTLFSYSVK
jgi:hypothetical protein